MTSSTCPGCGLRNGHKVYKDWPPCEYASERTPLFDGDTGEPVPWPSDEDDEEIPFPTDADAPPVDDFESVSFEDEDDFESYALESAEEARQEAIAEHRMEMAEARYERWLGDLLP